MTDWPDLDPHDTVLYQNDEGRPNRLVLNRRGDGFSIRVDSILGDTRQAPSLSREDLVDIAALMAVAARVDGWVVLARMQKFRQQEGGEA